MEPEFNRVDDVFGLSCLKYDMAYTNKRTEILPMSTQSLHGNLALGS